MKVIHRGELPGDKWYKATCSHCNSVMEFQKKEVQWSSSQREGDNVIFKCPVCSNTVNASPTPIKNPTPDSTYYQDPWGR